jgi:predicted  nucleic acid-binding Zn-ribbon protein
MAELTKKDLKLRKKLEKKQRKLEKKLRAVEQELGALRERPKTKGKAIKRVVAKSKKKRSRAPEEAPPPSALKPVSAADLGAAERDGQKAAGGQLGR